MNGGLAKSPDGPLAGERTERFLVTPKEAAIRLDVFLFRRDSLPTRSQVRRAILEGRVLVNQSRAKAGLKLRTGDQVCLRHKKPEPSGITPEPMELTIVYEDRAMLVVDKPAGMVVHPAFGHSSGTLVNAILAHCDDLSGIGGVERPGIVHRLDKDTSGLLVVAKSDGAHRNLTDQFRRREVGKVYLTLVYGTPREDEGRIDLPVGRDRVHRQKMSTRTDRGREALTRWRVRERYRFFSLLEVRIETGRTHQIRVHLNAIGHPVAGDPLYGGAGKRGDLDAAGRTALGAIGRQALHAHRLSFRHPESGENMVFTSPLPRDMAEFCAVLRTPLQE